jgi:hypothetical protein
VASGYLELSTIAAEEAKIDILPYMSVCQEDAGSQKEAALISEIVASRVGGKDGINLPNHRLPSFNTYFFSLMPWITMRA